jgi:hypothetical protein
MRQEKTGRLRGSARLPLADASRRAEDVSLSRITRIDHEEFRPQDEPQARPHQGEAETASLQGEEGLEA